MTIRSKELLVESSNLLGHKFLDAVKVVFSRVLVLIQDNESNMIPSKVLLDESHFFEDQ